MVEIVHKWSSFCTNSLRSSSYNDGNNSHNYSQFYGKGKSAWYTFKVITIQVYCLGRSSPSHSLRCSFQVCCFGLSCLRVFYGFNWPEAIENRFCCRSKIFDKVSRETLLKVMEGIKYCWSFLRESSFYSLSFFAI